MPTTLVKAGPDILRAYREAYAPTDEDADCRNQIYTPLPSVLIDHAGIAQYFAKIFNEVDWATGIQSLDDLSGLTLFTTGGAVEGEEDPAEGASNRMVPVEWGDYAEV